MNDYLMVCVDGVEQKSFMLRDANDGWNARAEREALDFAYELKTGSPDAVVSIVLSQDA